MHLELGNGIKLYYTFEGENRGTGKSVVLLHGFTGCGESWQTISRELAGSWRLIIPDLLGHGKSSAPENPDLYRIEAAAEHLASLLDQAADEPVHLLGYSMGGRLALYFALAYPQYVRSLVLESTSPGLAAEAERADRIIADEVLADYILSKGMVAFVERWENLPLFATQSNLSQEVIEHQRKIRLANQPVGLAGSLRGMGTGAQPSLWCHLARLICPVLLLVGEWDAKFLEINQRMVNDLPNATLAIIPRAGHSTHLGQPGLFIQRICEFWEQFESDTVQPRP